MRNLNEKGKRFCLCFVFILSLHALAVYAKESGTFSLYLVGTYDLRKDSYTLLHITNPTGQELFFNLAFRSLVVHSMGSNTYRLPLCSSSRGARID